MIEIYNLKDEIGLNKFKALTSKDNFLSSVFNNEGDIETQTNKFLKRLNYCLSICFKKIRVSKTKRNPEVEQLFARRKSLRKKSDENSIARLKEVENKLQVIILLLLMKHVMV